MRVGDNGGECRGDCSDEADDGQRQRVFRPQQRTGADRVSVGDQVLDVLLEGETDGDDGCQSPPHRDEASAERR